MNIKKEQALEDFIKEYNLLFNVPDFVINKKICEQYRKEHPSEFKKSQWSIVKHRKRMMDWLPKYRHSLKNPEA